ncbi:hypothetical protein M514_06682 [Trichuris suis]|uniref:Uncharacterized protein n=1 Tax=Trichuris suis TaxID=68888 RepID=A0A085NHN2_9BILA|nr:hypothetical protein M513_06682 [Trichuris suis]KFD68978.1 hypothetical protein M514_06682 [Trichuris suis]
MNPSSYPHFSRKPICYRLYDELPPWRALFCHIPEAHKEVRPVEGQCLFVGTIQNVSTEVPLLLGLPVFEHPIHQCLSSLHPVFRLKQKRRQMEHQHKVIGAPARSIAMLESASGGRTSTRALLYLCKATLEPGFSNSRSMVDRIRT